MPVTNARGIAVAKVGTEYKVYGFLTNGEGEYEDLGETVREKPSFIHFIYFGDKDYKECEKRYDFQ